jgi:hypothetical protein
MIDPNKVILDSEQSDAIIVAQAAEIRRLRLTDEEREAVSRMSFLLEQHGWREDAAVFRRLLERLK